MNAIVNFGRQRTNGWDQCRKLKITGVWTLHAMRRRTKQKPWCHFFSSQRASSRQGSFSGYIANTTKQYEPPPAYKLACKNLLPYSPSHWVNGPLQSGRKVITPESTSLPHCTLEGFSKFRGNGLPVAQEMAVNDDHTSKRQRRSAAEINESLTALAQSGLSLEFETQKAGKLISPSLLRRH